MNVCGSCCVSNKNFKKMVNEENENYEIENNNNNNKYVTLSSLPPSLLLSLSRLLFTHLISFFFVNFYLLE